MFAFYITFSLFNFFFYWRKFLRFWLLFIKLQTLEFHWSDFQDVKIITSKVKNMIINLLSEWLKRSKTFQFICYFLFYSSLITFEMFFCCIKRYKLIEFHCLSFKIVKILSNALSNHVGIWPFVLSHSWQVILFSNQLIWGLHFII